MEANANCFLVFGDNYFNIVWHFGETSNMINAISTTRSANNNNFPLSQQPHHHDIRLSSRQAIFAFIVNVLLNLVQIKYQGKLESPFETHPKTMLVTIASLLLYCSSYYDSKLRVSMFSSWLNTYITACCDFFAKIGMSFSGPLSLASILSLLLPESLCPLVFSLSVLFSLYELLTPSQLKTIWDLLIGAVINITDKFRCQPPQDGRRRRRGGGGEVQVRLPWLPQPAIINQLERLPV